MAEERKKLEDLNLLDNFLFGSVVTYPEYGEQFSRYLLKVVLNKNIRKLRVMPQSVFYGSDTSLHGATLDVYLEEQCEKDAEDATVYDVEPERDNHEKAIKAIPRRMRFYRAKLDGRGLKAGEDYGKLKDLVMIMITPFDPFGAGRMIYTVRNTCVESPDVAYDDGTIMIFLYTRGNPEGVTEELQQFLKYVEHSRLENAVSDDLRRLHEMVERVKRDEEVSIRFMRMWEEEERIRRRAMEEGLEEGRAEGRADAIMELLAEMGEVPSDLKEMIYSITDVNELGKINRYAAKATSLEAFTKDLEMLVSPDSEKIHI